MLPFELAATLHTDRKVRLEAAAHHHRLRLDARCHRADRSRLRVLVASLRRAVRRPARCVDVAPVPA